MSGVAVLVFVALYFVKAGYGMFRTSSWGLSLDNKLAWVLMEAPAFVGMLVCWLLSGAGMVAPQSAMALLFLLHYFQRSFVFPLLMKGKSRMPVSIMGMGIVFNVLNAWLIATGLFVYPPEGLYDEGWSFLLRPQSVLGILLFFVGMGINLHSDHVIRHLRKPGDTRHYIPRGGMFRYVSSANYFGELTEWVGFAIASWSWAGAVFAWWTFANLAPRAASLYKRYEKEFGQEFTSLHRKRIIPFIY